MGKPRNTQKYPTYPEIPEIPGNTRKKKRYPEIPDRIFRHSYPTRTQPATRYFVQYPTRPDPILKNPTRWALSMSPKKRLLMFYDQNRFSKLLMIFSAIHNFSKLFRILALCDSHLLLLFILEWSDTFSPYYTWCPKKATKKFRL